ncbi:pyridoxamine 5'-phosphate oxidase family protein [soil metagenome]
MQDNQNFDENRKKVFKMIESMDIGMFTTTQEDGSMRSRPMSVNHHVENNGDLWFFTYGSSHKVLEVNEMPQVNVSFADIKNNSYVSLSGTAELVRDKAKIAELWKPELKAWFPEGKETPDIALLKVNSHMAEYWDGPSNMVAQLLMLVNAATGKSNTNSIGENKKVPLETVSSSK